MGNTIFSSNLANQDGPTGQAGQASQADPNNQDDPYNPANQTNPINQIQYGKFIEFDSDGDGKIIMHNDKINKIKYTNCVVISMLGVSGSGKSVFINKFLSYLFKKQINIVKTQLPDNIDDSNHCTHCTIGIDYISFCLTTHTVDTIDTVNTVNTVPNLQIIILDCQGLQYEDSKNDQKLMSIVYSLSNIIIFHEIGKTIDSNTLTLLSELNVKSNVQPNDQLNNSTKPMLFFGLRDSIKDCIQDSIKDDNLQQSDICQLFSTIVTTSITSTSIISTTIDNEFESFCGKLLDNIKMIKPKDTHIFSSYIKYIVDQINDNKIKHISFLNYDCYAKNVEQKFYDYWIDFEHISNAVIEPTMYEKTYMECLKKKDQMNLIINDFYKVFSDMDTLMLENEETKFRNKIEPQIEATMVESINLANNRIDIEIEDFVKTKLLQLCENIKIYGDLQLFQFDLEHIKAECEFALRFFIKKLKFTYKLCSNSVDKYSELLIKQFENIFVTIEQIIYDEKIMFDTVVKNTLEQLMALTDKKYISNKIYEISNFNIQFDNHINDIKSIIYSDIENEFRNKLFEITIGNFTYDKLEKTIIINFNRNNKNEIDENNIFDSLIIEQIKKRMHDVFVVGRYKLNKIYLTHAKKQLSEYPHIPIDMIGVLSELHFNSLIISCPYNSFETIKIIMDILKMNCINCDFYKIQDSKYECRMLSRQIDKILNVLCEYIKFDPKFINDNIVIIQHPTFKNLKTYDITSNAIYYKIFIDNIISKYVNDKYTLLSM